MLRSDPVAASLICCGPEVHKLRVYLSARQPLSLQLIIQHLPSSTHQVDENVVSPNAAKERRLAAVGVCCRCADTAAWSRKAQTMSPTETDICGAAEPDRLCMLGCLFIIMVIVALVG